jgi:hypothetical protein
MTPAWEEAQRFYVPLVAQIIVQPRWFAPSVDGVWIEALHNGSELAMRFTWSDPSNSPAPQWTEWRRAGGRRNGAERGSAAQRRWRRMRDVGDGGPSAGSADPAATAAAVAQGWPDALAVWFPRTIPSGMQRPYFFMGSGRDPVYAWHWDSRAGTSERLGRGPGVLDPLPTSNALTGSAVWNLGQWRVVFHRPLAAVDSANVLTFGTGQPIPMAMFAWDGDNTETGTRGSLSTWYFVQLEEPVPATLYATPIIAVLLTAGLGILLVGRAQRRERENGLRQPDTVPAPS